MALVYCAWWLGFATSLIVCGMIKRYCDAKDGGNFKSLSAPYIAILKGAQKVPFLDLDCLQIYRRDYNATSYLDTSMFCVGIKNVIRASSHLLALRLF